MKKLIKSRRLIIIVLIFLICFECKLDVQLEDLELEKKFVENEYYETEDEELKHLLGKKFNAINEEIKKKYQSEEEPHKFVGIFSYFIGVNF